MNKSNINGRFGEDLVAKFLQTRGLEILQRNFRGGSGELDIVARQQSGRILFVEVKMRKVGAQVSPAEAVTADKQRRLLSAAQAWLAKNIGFETECGFWLVTVEGDSDTDAKIGIIEDFLCW